MATPSPQQSGVTPKPDIADKAPGPENNPPTPAAPQAPPAAQPHPPPKPPVDSIPILEPGEMVNLKSDNLQFEVILKLGAGSFGAVYKVRDTKYNDEEHIYAMKTESTKEKMQVLKMEVCVLKAIEQAGGRHFCRIIARGKNEKMQYTFVVMTLVGPSLSEMRRNYGASGGRRFSSATAVRVALQMMESLEDMHAVGYIHRDVKPANFAVGRAETNEMKKIYILDFGLCRRYRKPSGGLRLPRQAANFRGTVRYAPLNSHNLIELSRKDDLETWLYTVIELTSGMLPWTQKKVRQEVAAAKLAARKGPERQELLTNCPTEYGLLLDYIDEIGYVEQPDYDFVYQCLRRIMRKHTPPITDEDPYDWEPDAADPEPE